MDWDSQSRKVIAGTAGPALGVRHIRGRVFSGNCRYVVTVLVAVTIPPTNERGPQYMDQALAAIQQGNPDQLAVGFELAWHAGTVTLYCRFPPELRAIVEGQLYAQYPDCKIERLSDDALDADAGESTWTVELRVQPDIFPIKRYTQFEDALNPGAPGLTR